MFFHISITEFKKFRGAEEIIQKKKEFKTIDTFLQSYNVKSMKQ